MAIKADAKPITSWFRLGRVYEEACKAHMPERLLVRRLCACLPVRGVRWCGELEGFRGRPVDGIDLNDPATWEHATFYWAEGYVALYVSGHAWRDRRGRGFRTLVRVADLFLQIAAEDMPLLIDQPIAGEVRGLDWALAEAKRICDELPRRRGGRVNRSHLSRTLAERLEAAHRINPNIDLLSAGTIRNSFNNDPDFWSEVLN